jgi:Putative peptidoglycan binding domain
MAFGTLALPAGQAGAGTLIFGSRPLQEGMRGRDVRVLQDFLTRAGLRTAVDGRFGPGTSRRVRSWERRTGRPVDGRVSRTDARALRTAVDSSAPAPEAVPVAAPTQKATVGPDDLATLPISAPPEVRAIIESGNQIAAKPYKYGGGHGRWNDSGYDCSGSMSYALHGAGLLDEALDSSGFMTWGDPGKGQWVTIYAKGSHSFMRVAGLRFDTSGRSSDGTRWHAEMRSTGGYTVRHPAGL